MKIKNVLIISPSLFRISQKSRLQYIDINGIFKKTNKFLKCDKIPITIWHDGEDRMVGFLEKIRLKNKGIFGDIQIDNIFSVEIWCRGRNKNLIRRIRIIKPFKVADIKERDFNERKRQGNTVRKKDSERLE